MLTFPPGNRVFLRRKCSSRGRMSWETPQFREELRLQRENVLETTPKPGETAVAEGKCPGKRPKTWRKCSSRKKYPRKGTKTWRKCTPREKCPWNGLKTWRKCTLRGKRPGKRYNSGRKCLAEREMSWKPPLNREKLRLQRGNVLETTPKPGETTAAEGKCPGKHPKTRRNRSRRAQRKHRCNKKRHPNKGKAFLI